MEVSFVCSNCTAKLKFDAASYPPGTEVACPDCSANISIPRPEIGPGVTVGGFELLRLLGKGGMGEVYLARQISMNREVAVKILPPSFGLREEQVRRFRREVQMAARLKLANIVRAHEAGEDLGVHYLAMEYVEGANLGEHLRESGPIPEAEARAIVEKLARALRLLWEKHQMMHRDIKPANIMLDEDGEPQLTDLGVSKALDEGAGMTGSVDITGTPHYMSPEQVMGEEIDFRTDMYSLGATLYHLLTARLPFHGSSVVSVLHKQTTEDLPDPREVKPDISPELVSIIRRMMAKQPQDRYADWDEFLEALCNSPSKPHAKNVARSRRTHLLWGAGTGIALVAALGLFFRPKGNASAKTDQDHSSAARFRLTVHTRTARGEEAGSTDVRVALRLNGDPARQVELERPRARGFKRAAANTFTIVAFPGPLEEVESIRLVVLEGTDAWELRDIAFQFSRDGNHSQRYFFEVKDWFSMNQIAPRGRPTHQSMDFKFSPPPAETLK